MRDIHSPTGLHPAATTADGWLHYRIHETPEDLAVLTPRVAQEPEIWIDTETADWNTKSPRLSPRPAPPRGREPPRPRGKLQVVCPGGRCADLSETDMSHLEDAVRYWNREGYKHGPKSPEVRDFMLDPKNYELEPSAENRARGGATTDRYREPAPKPTPQPEPNKPQQ